ncbi:hypothetical protein SH580_00640 [Coraliomargarita algicola]|uniref:Tfp pilus assembly protein PilX n=1 Tax=Coraliomargarita algicola TaxID=3092156 RepID=A0ABZ0RL00_9BACT|nr:hypothetical protein [Coraliomargarita sp. J2-16]WPJ96207.1 hypothetical protein SH580_00640 [Coraliomargarita sp. J2-16]
MLSSRTHQNQLPIRSNQGFALVIALGLMAFVVMLLLTVSTLVKVETQSSVNQQQKIEAQQAALLSLNIAIGELQKAAGPDQRITATAEIINDPASLYTPGGTTPLAGQASWTGVWKSDTVANGTASYSPKEPNTREFVGWLVSRASASDETALELPTTLEAIETTPSANIDLATDSDGISYATVGKVKVETQTANDTYYAFMVEDESVKADLSWSEHLPSSLSSARYQASRLAAAPGPDFGVLNDLSAGDAFGTVSYPLTIDGNTLLTDTILKMGATSDVTTSMTDRDTALDWLKDTRGDVTWGSRGVMADVKWGGLRRDLSLAFEMDGDADVTASEQPTKFNQQIGEFVGGSDRYAAPVASPGMGGNVARHLYRDFSGSGSLFDDSFASSSSVIRGPTWWAVRDYANLYKRLSLSGNKFSLDARAYYPNRSGGATEITDLYPVGAGGGVWHWEYKNGDTSKDYIYRPARANYSPVYLGMTTLIGIKVIGSEVALSLDPIFHFWNPYNVDLNFDNIAITMDVYAFAGNITIWTKKSGESTETKTEFKLTEVVNNNDSINTETSFLLQNTGGGAVTMTAGEVMVFSATPVTSVSPSKIKGTAEPGYFDGGFNDTGIIVTNLPGVPDVEAGDEIGFVYRRGISGDGSNRSKLQTSLPPIGANESNVFDNPGEDMQGYILNLAPFDKGYNEYVSSLADVKPEDAKSVSQAGTSLNANVPIEDLEFKRFFGLYSLLSKPAFFTANPDDGSSVESNPVEIYSRFNPLYYTTNEEIWHSVPPNMLFNVVSSFDPNDLINNYGMQLSTSGRNAFWGAGFDSSGSTSIPMLDIPTSPLISLVSFSNANLSVMATEPMRAVGNSLSNPFFQPTAPYGGIRWHPNQAINETGGDTSWLINDSLFDRYYLSGFAPAFTIGSGGYSVTGTMEATLSAFFSNDYSAANANPVLRPYLPANKTVAEVVAELKADDGYLKTAAYSLIDGQFNVNSTSVAAWEALLRANRDLAVTYAQDSASDSPSSDTPFPNGTRPSNPSAPGGLETKPEWAGLSRLTDSQIEDLAEKIVDQVKLRGPFMSLSDFVNHRVGPLNTSTSYSGAIQAALDLATASSNINSGSRSALGSVDPDYSSGFYEGGAPASMKTTAGIATDITQANVLLPLAPRLSARSDTFRIRAYGEVKATVGSGTVTAVCEAVVQRLPEYVDSISDDPWDEAIDPLNASGSSQLSDLNQRFGRQYQIVSFRWLSENEI